MPSIKTLLNQPIDPVDAEVLLAYVLKKPKEYLFANQESGIRNQEAKKFLKLVKKRKLGWPVAYLIQKKEFFGLKFFVNKNVLVPRPETEGLVELAQSQISNLKSPISILDIGTGSGNIIIALAKILSANSHEYAHGHQYFASDISPQALLVAKKNAKEHKLKITFKQGNLLEPWENQGFDVMVANLPYLAKRTDPSTRLEPTRALVTGKKGLALYEKLFKELSLREVPLTRVNSWRDDEAISFPRKRLLRPIRPKKIGLAKTNMPKFIFLEIGHDQNRTIKKLIKNFLPDYNIKISKDLAGRIRYAVLAKKSF